MSRFSRPIGSLALAGLFLATFIPGMAPTEVTREAAGALPDCCAGSSCCGPGHDCAIHGGCDGMKARPGDRGRADAARASAARATPPRLCLTNVACGADQPLPAPHVFDPMVPVVASAIAAPPRGERTALAPGRSPRSAPSEPWVPPPRI